MSFIDKVFGGGVKALAEAGANIVDKFIQSPDEKAAAKLEWEREMNRHVEAMRAMATKENELENADRESARERQIAYLKAHGRADWFQYFVGAVVLICFVGVVIYLLNKAVPEENTAIVHNLTGILEGAVIAIVTFYYGSARTARGQEKPPAA